MVPLKTLRGLAHLFERRGHGLVRPQRITLRVVGVGGETEPNRSLVTLLRARVELRQAGEVAEHQRQHSGGQRIERAQVPYRTLRDDAAHAVDHVVRGQPRRFIDDEHAVHEKIQDYYFT